LVKAISYLSLSSSYIYDVFDIYENRNNWKLSGPGNMLKSDLFVAIVILIASTLLFLIDPSWETLQFVITMIVLYCAVLWLKEILERNSGN